jgi:type I restriction enzyme S subunit
MKKYESYNDSRIEWIGEIPSHWEVKKLKYVSSINDDTLSDTTEDEFEIEYADISSIESGVGITKTDHFTFKEAPSRARRLVKDGDVIVSTVRTYLKAIAKVKNPKPNLVVSTGFAVVRPKDIVSEYAGHLFFHENLLGEIVSRSVGVSYPAINSSEIGSIKIPLPKSKEQNAIAH